MGVASGSREWRREQKNGGGVYVMGIPKGVINSIKKLYEKICSVGNIGPGRLGPFFNRSVP